MVTIKIKTSQKKARHELENVVWLVETLVIRSFINQ